MVDSSTQTKETMSDPIWRDRYDRAMENIEARQALRDEILERIAPYQSGYRRPPFKAGHLIVMALVCADKERLSQQEIHRWILRSFPYFGNRLMDWYLDAYQEPQDGDYNPPGEFVKGFGHAIRHFDLPLDEHQRGLDSLEFSLTTGAAKLALARLSETERAGTFPFLKLAPELRNRIYEMLFKYPAPGIGFLGYRIDRKSILLSRSNSDRSFTELQHPDLDQYVFTEPIHTTLAIARTCKQILKEAMPMFYGMNTFYFGSIDDVHRKIDRLPLTRAKHFKDVHLELYYLDRDGGPFEAVFHWLSQLSLDKLSLHMTETTEREWLYDFQKRGQGQWTENKIYKRRLWIMIGVVMKAKRVEVCGNCPAFKTFMRSKVQIVCPDDAEGS